MTKKTTYRITKRLTHPLLKLKPGEPIAVRFTGDEPKMVQIDSKPGPDGAMKKPATTLRCVNLADDVTIDLIAPQVLLSQLVQEYGGYGLELSNKTLLIESTGKREGKAYNDVVLSEIVPE